MKHMRILLVLLFVMFFVLPALSASVFAAYKTNSNEVRVGFGGPPDLSPGGGDGTVPDVRPSSYRQALIDEFGITMNGFPDSNYQWAWEFMHRASNTRFPEYAAGTVVGVDDGGSHMTGCKTIFLRSTYPSYELFAPIFAHEIGHVVFRCTPGGGLELVAQHSAALEAEGPLTPYSQNLCLYKNPTPDNRVSENFSETIAYYLNPESDAVTGCGSGPNPYAGGAHPRHLEVARNILEK